ncbi:hypothetical protein EDB81DRAFT_916297 [Dactylonectria macrodidyma]|uniref:Myb/SANT-like domain-containing protein n=1 Tax=Dactylonectria macrodidyma TaxID=307937 RepID=A0A9P9DE31_9HYPO|nr:hypothetical protein EDB81DRAFT_916297 [Dactylonectria macrodidyma]
MPPHVSESSTASQTTTQPDKEGNSRGWRWTKSQTLFLLAHLVIARNKGKLKSKKNSILKAVFEEFLAPFNQRFPQQNWVVKTFEGKYRTIRDFWRVFLEMSDTSGTTYNDETGKLSMSSDNRATFLEKYPNVAKQCLNAGLLIGGDINFESYEKIFSDDLPAGALVLEADDAGFRALVTPEDVPDENDPFASGSDDDGDDDNVELLESTPRTPAVTASSQTGKRAASSTRFPANPGPSFSSKRRKVVAGNMTLDDMKELFPAEASRTHQVLSRLPGSEDLEKAVSDSMALQKHWGLRESIRVITWLKKDPMHAIIWNSIKSIEGKEALMASEAANMM